MIGSSESGAGDVEMDLGARLVGAAVPALWLDSTVGPVSLAELAGECLVLYLYPHATGLPDPPVPGWDSIPGARGCTAQSCAFRDRQNELEALGARIFGLAAQTIDEQNMFAARIRLNYPLISDPERRLAALLGLPTFTAGGRTFYTRLTLIARKGLIAKAFYPVTEPELNAAEVAEWLRRTE
ncbi:MAG TPA: peroxiredoxin [Gaiellaceae bacterium]|nr:peroxiredoxin [Gaiellaceae bacterium]